MKSFALSIVLILCSVHYMLSIKEGVSYKFQRSLCNKFNPKFIYNTTCRVRHLNRTTQLINSEVHIQPNVSIDNVRIDFTSYIKFRTVFRPSLIKYSEFICDSLRNGVYSHLINAFQPSYKKFSNLFQPCPRSVAVYGIFTLPRDGGDGVVVCSNPGKIFVKDMVVDITSFPQFLPIGEYRVDITTFTYMNGEEEFVMLNQEYVEVKPLGALQF